MHDSCMELGLRNLRFSRLPSRLLGFVGLPTLAGASVPEEITISFFLPFLYLEQENRTQCLSLICEKMISEQGMEDKPDLRTLSLNLHLIQNFLCL